jgi:restriction system protein
MVKEGGVWTPTGDGLAAHRSYTDPEQFMEEAEKLYRVWAKAQPAKESESDSEAELPDASLTLEEAEETAWKEVREFLHAMDPYDFQHLVAGLLSGMGYEVTWVAPPGKDGGVDIVALGDPVGAKGPRVKVQVKREKSRTDAQTLRAFTSVLREGDVGLFVTLAASRLTANPRFATRRVGSGSSAHFSSSSCGPSTTTRSRRKTVVACRSNSCPSLCRPIGATRSGHFGPLER